MADWSTLEPPRRRASFAAEPVAWIPDSLAERCYQCECSFSLVIWKHHCRRCGNVFCDGCSSKSIPLLDKGHMAPVRVCNACYDIATQATPELGASASPALPPELLLAGKKSDSPDNTAVHEGTSDLEMQRELIPGELLVRYGDFAVIMNVANGLEIKGRLHLTNYRALFVAVHTNPSDGLLWSEESQTTSRAVSIPLLSVRAAKRTEIPATVRQPTCSHCK
jgi:hypothetical protein